MPLTRYHKQHLIDPVISPWLDELYTLPAKDAVDVLNCLCQIKQMSVEEAKSAPDELVLPEALQATRFASIQTELQMLYRIMRSPNPQDATRTHGDQGAHMRWGVFNLNPPKPKPYDPSEIATDENVHAYLIEQFQARIWIIENVAPTILPHIQTMLGRWKQNSEHKQAYYRAFFALVKHKDTKPIQSRMQTLLQALQLSKQKRGMDASEEKESTPQHHATVSSVEVAKHLSLLPPEMIDLETTQLFEAFCQLQPMPTSVKMHVSYNAVREKIIQQINSSKPFPHIEAVISSFALVHRVYLLLEKHRLFCEQQPGMGNVRQLEAMCHRYVANLNEQDAALQQGLSSEEKAQLMSFEQSAQSYLQENHHAWIGSFFALYFGPDDVLNTKDLLYTKLIDLAFIQNKIMVDGPWLSAVLQNQQAHGFVDLSPYHINRIFLHACITPPDSDAWSPIFYQVFSAVIDLVENRANEENEENSFRHAQLQRASYPDAFIQQLKFLRDKYAELHPSGDANASGDREEIKQDHVVPGSDQNPQPPSVFPLMYFPNSWKEVADMLRFLPVKQAVTIYTDILQKGRVLIQNADDLRMAMSSLRTATANHAIVLDTMLKAGTLLPLMQNIHYFQMVMGPIADQRAVLDAMLQAGTLLPLIQSTNDFQKVMQSFFTVEHQGIVLDAMLKAGTFLPLIQNISDFERVMKSLIKEHQAIVIDAMWKAGKLLPLIQNIEDFERVIKALSTKDQAIVLDAMLTAGTFLPLIRNTEDFERVIKTLATKDQVAVLHAMLKADTLRPLIRNIKDLRQVIQSLSAGNPAIVLNVMLKAKTIRPLMIQNIQMVMGCIADQKAVVDAMLQAGTLLPLIQSTHDFQRVMKSVQEITKLTVLDAMLKAGTFLPLIQNVNDFQRVMGALKEVKKEKQAIVLDAMLEAGTLLPLIRNIEDFEEVMMSVVDNQAIVLEAMLKVGALLPLIQNVNDFQQTMRCLSIPARKKVLDAMLKAGTLLPLMQNINDFWPVMRLLGEANQAIVLEAMLNENKLLGLIQNINDFQQLVRPLSTENQAIVLNGMLRAGALLPLIRNIQDFQQVIQFLSAENPAIVWNVMLKAGTLPPLMIHNIQMVMGCIADQRAVVDAMLQAGTLLLLIQSANDFRQVMEALRRIEKKAVILDYRSAQNQITVFDAMWNAGALLPLIQNSNDFQQVMGCLEYSRYVSVEDNREEKLFDALWNADMFLPLIQNIQNISDLQQVMGTRSNSKKNQAKVLDAMLRQQKLPGLIQNVNDFQRVMDALSTNRGSDQSLSTENKEKLLYAMLRENAPHLVISTLQEMKDVCVAARSESRTTWNLLFQIIRNSKAYMRLLAELSPSPKTLGDLLNSNRAVQDPYDLRIPQEDSAKAHLIQRLHDFQQQKQSVGFFKRSPLNDATVGAAQWLEKCLLAHDFSGLNEQYLKSAPVLREGELGILYGEVLHWLCQYGPADQAKVALLNKLEDYVTERAQSLGYMIRGTSDPEMSAACAIRDALNSVDISQLECISRDHINVVTGGGLSVLYKAAIQLAGRDDNVEAPEAKEEHLAASMVC